MMFVGALIVLPLLLAVYQSQFVTSDDECNFSTLDNYHIRIAENAAFIGWEEDVDEEADCDQLCEDEDDCTASDWYYSYCYLFRLPIVDYIMGADAAECETQCLNNTQCLSFSSEYGENCYLYNTTSNELSTEASIGDRIGNRVC